MREIIKLENGQEIMLDNNLAWLMEYQDQFGEDIVPTLMPLIMSFADFLGALAEDGIDLDNLDVKAVLSVLKSEAALDAWVKLSSFKTTDIIAIVWAMAKAADDKIDPPKKWIRQFEDGFPLDVIVPKAATMAAQGVMTSKNWERLTATWSKLRPQKEVKK